MPMKSTPRGVAGNAERANTPLRDWASRSYSSTTGTAASSLADQRNMGSPSTTHAENISAQIPGGFERADRKRTTNSRPVRTRPFTEQYD